VARPRRIAPQRLPAAAQKGAQGTLMWRRDAGTLPLTGWISYPLSLGSMPVYAIN
jgi:hypothetical protein